MSMSAVAIAQTHFLNIILLMQWIISTVKHKALFVRNTYTLLA